MDNLDPNYMRLRELLENLTGLSPDNGDSAGRIHLYTRDGQFVGEVLPSTKDLEALNETVARLTEIAESMRKHGPSGGLDDLAAAADAEYDEFHQILWELEDLTPWDPAVTGEATTTIPAPRVSALADAALWAAVHGDLAADLADIYNEVGLFFPTGSEGGDA